MPFRNYIMRWPTRILRTVWTSIAVQIQLISKDWGLNKKNQIRIINNAGYRDHTVPLFKANKILPLDALIKFLKLKFMHNFVYHKLPFSFREMWTYNVDRNPNRTHHFATIKRFPLFEFPRSWKEEEENRKSIQSSYIYCKQLKIFLLASLVD